jgi:hypothetical protein
MKTSVQIPIHPKKERKEGREGVRKGGRKE